MEIFKTQKPCLILFLLIFHCSSLHRGHAMPPAETTEGITTQQQVSDGLKQDRENLPLVSPLFPIPARNKNSPFGPSLYNPGQLPQTVFPPQQLNYPQQSLNQPLSGFGQPFSSFNQPFGVGNQQGLGDNSNTLDNGVSEKNRLTIAIALMANL